MKERRINCFSDLLWKTGNCVSDGSVFFSVDILIVPKYRVDALTLMILQIFF